MEYVSVETPFGIGMMVTSPRQSCRQPLDKDRLIMPAVTWTNSYGQKRNKAVDKPSGLAAYRARKLLREAATEFGDTLMRHKKQCVDSREAYWRMEV